MRHANCGMNNNNFDKYFPKFMAQLCKAKMEKNKIRREKVVLKH